MVAEKVKIDIVSGFLGAGKTTFINTIANEVFKNMQIAILENEFGTIDFDSENIANKGFVVESVHAGCICCSGAGSFTKGIATLVDNYHPQRIIIEPSGVARVSDIIRIIRSEEIAKKCSLSKIITIVDVTNYDKYIKVCKELFQDQIRFSQIIILSKTEHKTADIDRITDAIYKINPHCILFSDTWNSQNTKQLQVLLTTESNQSDQFYYSSNETKKEFDVFSYESSITMDKQSITELLKTMIGEEYGEVLRIKGDVVLNDGSTYSLNYPSSKGISITLKENINEGSKDHRFRLSIIGLSLDKELIKSKIQELTNHE